MIKIAKDLSVAMCCFYNGEQVINVADQHCTLLLVMQGVVRVDTQKSRCVVVLGRGVWIPAGVEYTLNVMSNTEIKSVYVDPFSRADLSNDYGLVHISPLLNALVEECIFVEPNYGMGTREERIIELVLDELRRLSVLDFDVPFPKDVGLQNLCQRISERIHFPWSIADAADVLNVSERTVSRQFLQVLGLSFTEWLRRERLLKSMEMLASGVSVLDTALNVGYESPSAFSAVFKSRIGMSPMAYVQSIVE